MPQEVLAKLSAQHLAAIEAAPPRFWEGLAANAAQGGWSVELTERMAKDLLEATPEEAERMLADPHLPVRLAKEAPTAGEPVIALETVLKRLGPPHLDPNRARVALRHYFSAMGALGFFDADLVIGAFGAGEWEDLQRELEVAQGLVTDLQAALERARTGRRPVLGGGQ
jgi:hypothetical protein